ncbi:MAG: hypothetical protein R3E89_08835 [Thiolinea sp.]
MLKYQDLIDNIPEGSPEEKQMFDQIMAEFNNAPANEQLNGLEGTHSRFCFAAG